MTYAVALTDDAARDLDELYAQCHLLDGFDEAELLLDRIQDVFRSLAENPEAGSHPPELSAQGIRDYRAITIDPYRVVYRSSSRDVYVLMIADMRRDLQLSLQRRLLES